MGNAETFKELDESYQLEVISKRIVANLARDKHYRMDYSVGLDMRKEINRLDVPDESMNIFESLRVMLPVGSKPKRDWAIKYILREYAALVWYVSWFVSIKSITALNYERLFYAYYLLKGFSNMIHHINQDYSYLCSSRLSLLNTSAFEMPRNHPGLNNGLENVTVNRILFQKRNSYPDEPSRNTLVSYYKRSGSFDVWCKKDIASGQIDKLDDLNIISPDYDLLLKFIIQNR